MCPYQAEFLPHHICLKLLKSSAEGARIKSTAETAQPSSNMTPEYGDSGYVLHRWKQTYSYHLKLTGENLSRRTSRDRYAKQTDFG
ncbi:hypothetical protein O9993_05760 [Vibrio lentus]|nr:hypothetical protein [Vibrio lentus]